MCSRWSWHPSLTAFSSIDISCRNHCDKQQTYMWHMSAGLSASCYYISRRIVNWTSVIQVTGHKTDDRFTNAINNIQKFIDYLCTYLFILYISNIFAANAVKSTTDSIWTNLSNKSISNMLAEVSEWLGVTGQWKTSPSAQALACVLITMQIWVKTGN